MQRCSGAAVDRRACLPHTGFGAVDARNGCTRDVYRVVSDAHMYKSPRTEQFAQAGQWEVQHVIASWAGAACGRLGAHIVLTAMTPLSAGRCGMSLCGRSVWGARRRDAMGCVDYHGGLRSRPMRLAGSHDPAMVLLTLPVQL
jgi:hypothetical protein